MSSSPDSEVSLVAVTVHEDAADAAAAPDRASAAPSPAAPSAVSAAPDINVNGGGGGGVKFIDPPPRPTPVAPKTALSHGMSHHMSHHLSRSASSMRPAQSPPGTQAVSAYNSPKDTLLLVIKAGMAKALLPIWQIFLLAFNAGFFLGIGNLAGLVIAGGLSAPQRVLDSTGALIETIEPQGVWASFAHGAIFPLGLVIIVLAGSELFTGNIMYLSVAYASGKISMRSVWRNWAIVWVGNFVGAVILAFFLAYLPQLLHTGPHLGFLTKVGIKKLSLGWGNVFLRGVGCNWCVCLALWCNLTAQDVVSKILAIWWPVSFFLWIGWEHSVANMFALPLALMEDATGGKGFGEVLAWNIIPVSLGNMLGGFLFAMGQMAAYGTYAAPKLEILTTKHHVAKEESRLSKTQ